MMGYLKLITSSTLAIGLLITGMNLHAHGTGSGDSTDGFMVTRHFTGSWDQVDQESQGLSLDVVEQQDGSRRSVVYWFTYGTDRKATWYLGIGDLVDDRIEFVLYESTDVGFMQDAVPGDDSVHSIGTMTNEGDDLICAAGEVLR